MIKAITFDLWGTLIKGSPDYKLKRAQFIQQHSDKHSIEEINKTIAEIKASFDSLVEAHGFHYNSLTVYNTIVKELGIHLTLDGFELRSKCHNLFLEHPPHLYSDETKNVLESLSKQVPLYLISNTVLIDAGILRQALTKLEIDKYFKKLFFSNEVGVSKPNLNIYKLAHETICERKEFVLHVGDNEITDYNGAKTYGFQAKRINSNKHNIKTIEFLLKNQNENHGNSTHSIAHVH